ncbi:L,D-transpeptidase family protein [Ectobacillus ponti]|uniref:L,D-transpeptidase/peptidoglycan binding protein n=1 Tax=Ectobacillus ponti TaxID=2961894 RepID=A0AA42BTW9_9BACI|nr:L,D-transpeptidase family protein [Ectobacillus ponti]MCP8969928.1 L,D-transpeptidase/peptidoglycan binding protein [Ectobacillus ponti]
MENAMNELEVGRRQTHAPKRSWSWKIAAPVVVSAAIVAAVGYYQATHFNKNVKINDTSVGGLTAEEALSKLKSSVLKNEVYIGKNRVIDEKDTKMAFADKDLSEVQKLLKSQQTFFPSSKEVRYSLLPGELDQYRSQTLKKQVEEKLLAMNKELKAPQDAQAVLEKGTIKVVKSVDGQQYDVASLLKDYEKQEYNSEVHLNPAYTQPIKEDSQVVKDEKNKLEALLQQSTEYKVQDKVYSLKASDLIQNASVAKDMKLTIDTALIKNKIAEINSAQATLNKPFTFKTHAGATISVQGEGYGWALNREREAAQIADAFEKGTKSLAAANISGNGWEGEGYGYNTTANNGIGDTYAEVSIQEQRIWLYRNGQLVFTTPVVTGRHNTAEDTSPGVWYILYKRTPATLKGTSVGHGGSYSVKVDYWAPFTNSGQGFHDASWRTNWASNAYLTAGSGGCVNVPPSVAKTVYDNLTTHQPVVVY